MANEAQTTPSNELNNNALDHVATSDKSSPHASVVLPDAASSSSIGDDAIVDVQSVTTSQGTVIKLGVASNQDAINLVDGFRDSFNTQVAADSGEMKALRARTLRNTYILLAAFCGICFKLLHPTMKSFLAFVLGEHGLKPAATGHNPFRPLADMLFGEWVSEIIKDEHGKPKLDKNNKVKKREQPETATATRTVNGEKEFFVPNRSAEKYAKIARFADRMKWKQDEIADNLANFKGKLKGVEDADTALSAGTDADDVETEKLVKMVYAAKPHSTLDTSDCGFGPADMKRKLVCLWAEVDGDDVKIRGVMPTSEDTIKAYVRKYAKANEAKLYKQALERQSTAES